MARLPVFAQVSIVAELGILWQDTDMNRDQVIATLREHEPELKAAGVAHLALHGSYVRGAAVTGVSDVDVGDAATRSARTGAARVGSCLLGLRQNASSPIAPTRLR